MSSCGPGASWPVTGLSVSRWATANKVELSESFAYSDSLYDLPLLSAVGHPHAVNPDPRLRAVATLRRWPVLFLDVPPGVPKLFGLEPADVVRLLSRPELIPYARFDIRGVERVPGEGGAVVVANHRSYFDVAALGLTAARRGRPLRFLGKKEVFDAPVVGQLARALGGIRVDRGSGSAEPLREAARKSPGPRYVRGDALRLPFGDGTFEAVTIAFHDFTGGFLNAKDSGHRPGDDKLGRGRDGSGRADRYSELGGKPADAVRRGLYQGG